MLKTSERLLTLLSLLQARRDWPGSLLAERLDVSPRTVRRDVDRLRELGYPVAAFKGPDGGYRLGAGSELPPLLFDDGQAVALAIALQIATQSGAGIEEDAVRALSTVREVMPSRLRHRIDAMTVTAVPRSSIRPNSRVTPAALSAIGAAVHGREVLRFDYGDDASERRPGPPRQVEPHHLITWRSRWYLVGFDRGRDDWRIFRADRVELRTPNGPRFTRRTLPGGDVAAFVTSRFRASGDLEGQWPCRGEAIVHLPIAKVAPFTDELVEPVGPDRCLLREGSWSWTALAASLGRFEADFDVVGPPELADAVSALGRRFVAAGADRAPADKQKTL